MRLHRYRSPVPEDKGWLPGTWEEVVSKVSVPLAWSAPHPQGAGCWPVRDGAPTTLSAFKGQRRPSQQRPVQSFGTPWPGEGSNMEPHGPLRAPGQPLSGGCEGRYSRSRRQVPAPGLCLCLSLSLPFCPALPCVTDLAGRSGLQSFRSITEPPVPGSHLDTPLT